MTVFLKVFENSSEDDVEIIEVYSHNEKHLMKLNIVWEYNK